MRSAQLTAAAKRRLDERIARSKSAQNYKVSRVSSSCFGLGMARSGGLGLWRLPRIVVVVLGVRACGDRVRNPKLRECTMLQILSERPGGQSQCVAAMAASRALSCAVRKTKLRANLRACSAMPL